MEDFTHKILKSIALSLSYPNDKKPLRPNFTIRLPVEPDCLPFIGQTVGILERLRPVRTQILLDQAINPWHLRLRFSPPNPAAFAAVFPLDLLHDEMAGLTLECARRNFGHAGFRAADEFIQTPLSPVRRVTIYPLD